MCHQGHSGAASHLCLVRAGMVFWQQGGPPAAPALYPSAQQSQWRECLLPSSQQSQARVSWTLQVLLMALQEQTLPAGE